MKDYISQIETDFGSWGVVFSVRELFSKDPSPFKRIMENGFSRANSKMVFSVCPDDFNRNGDQNTIVYEVRSVFGDESHLGTLGAYPAGVDKLIEIGSEINDDGNKKRKHLIIYISPHTSLTITDQEVIYGYVSRFGQSKFTASCDGIMKFLKSLRHVTSLEELKKISDGIDDDDRVKSLLFKKLLAHYGQEIVEKMHSQDMNATVMMLAKFNYELVMNTLKKMVQGCLEEVPFDGDYAIIGGITINTEKGDFFVFRDYSLNSVPY